jgi:hypothetical protein
LKYLKIFNVNELETLINGISLISIDEWQENTEYKGEFHVQHKLIIWFWIIMRTYTQEELGKVLHFSTGSSRISLEGFRYIVLIKKSLLFN